MASSGNDEDADSKGTPKSLSLGISDTSDQPSTSDFSITNPFESHNTIDSLLLPSFSPSVFTTNPSSDTDEQSTPSQFWNIDQIAVLKPTDIDLSTLPNQQDFLRLDATAERRAQQAIEEFFASHIELPSPWSNDHSKSHYIALISPSPAQMKKRANLTTPCTGRPGVPSSSTTSSLSSSSQIRVRKLQLHPNSRHPQSTSKDGAAFSAKQQRTYSKECKNVSTQTTLTLPKGIDLESILKQYYTFSNGAENQNDTLNNTSLRRKLIFPDGCEVQTRDRDGNINLNSLQQIDDIQELEEFSESPVPLKKIQPDNNNLTPLVHSNHGNFSRTPSTCQSQFSSSPVGFEHKTPCSINSQRLRFGSDVRRRKVILGSSEDEELMDMQLEPMQSPELSPVKCDSISGVEGHIAEVRDVTEDESMSFNVCNYNPSHKISPAGENHLLRNQLSTMESSRRQLVLESPTLSPIEPIKFKSNVAQSSINQVNLSRSLGVPAETHVLCPSPMLSPIPCKGSNKPPAEVKGIEACRQTTSALLSSTVTQPIVTANTPETPVKPAPELEADTSRTISRLGRRRSNVKVQYLEEKVCVDSNKENISPQNAECSSMLSTDSQGEDISMPLDETPNGMCNDIYMQAEQHSSSVLYCREGFVSSSIPAHSRKQPVTSVEIMSKNSDGPILSTDGHQPMKRCLEVENALVPKLNTTMDVSVIQMQCRVLDDSASPQRPTEQQGDSGYSTTQSNNQVA